MSPGALYVPIENRTRDIPNEEQPRRAGHILTGTEPNHISKQTISTQCVFVGMTEFMSLILSSTPVIVFCFQMRRYLHSLIQTQLSLAIVT
jgi:hypothetical protein